MTLWGLVQKKGKNTHTNCESSDGLESQLNRPFLFLTHHIVSLYESMQQVWEQKQKCLQALHNVADFVLR